MKKIGIYGGSFDPPHNGHKLLASNLAKACNVDKVLIIPTAMSPFKNSWGASPEDRLEMCKLAFSESLFEVSDTEIRRGGKSYTVDTVKEIKNQYPDSELFLFMGDDMLLSFSKWYKFQEILSMCTVVAACRTENLEKLQEMKEYGKTLSDDKILIFDCAPVEMSSTGVRESIRKGENVDISADVYNFIKSKGLYMNRNAEYIEILKGRLTEQRFIHSLNVADTAKELARIYGCDEERAYTVGLVHDCCKDVPVGLDKRY